MTLRAATTSALTLISVGAFVVAAPIASAQDTYRYWSYWYAEGPSWQYATEGSGTRVPADGDIEGWRFGFANSPDDIKPTTAPDFAVLCADTPESPDRKRVAVVVEFGDGKSAPDGEVPPPSRTACVSVDVAATGYQILTELVDVRIDAGFVCSIEGFPAQECAPLVEEPDDAQETVPASEPEQQEDVSASTTPAQETQSSAAPAIITALTLSFLAVVGFRLWRRSQRRARL